MNTNQSAMRAYGAGLTAVHRLQRSGHNQPIQAFSYLLKPFATPPSAGESEVRNERRPTDAEDDLLDEWLLETQVQPPEPSGSHGIIS